MKEITKVLLKTKKELEAHKLAKGAYSFKANGKTKCSLLSKDAKCLCLLGALHKAVNINPDEDCLETDIDEQFSNLFNKVTNYAYKDGNQADPAKFNDDKKITKKDVLNVLDAMIALSKLSF